MNDGGQTFSLPPLIKTCSTCKLSLPFERFSKNAGAKDGLQKLCKQCHSSYLRQYRTPERIKEGNLRQRYKMGLADYYVLLNSQGGVCAACGNPPTDKYLQIDHDHKCCPTDYTCGQCIRALLCRGCNVALGALNDDLDRLQKLIKYLEKCNDR